MVNFMLYILAQLKIKIPCALLELGHINFKDNADLDQISPQTFSIHDVVYVT